MGNQLTARIEVQGIRPLLWHAFGPDAIPLEKGERTGVAGNDPEEWKKTVLATPSRQLYLEATYPFGCMVNGAKSIKKGRGSLQPMVAATLQIVDDTILVDRFIPEAMYERASDFYNAKHEPVYLDVRGVVNKATKGRNVRYRVAAASGWRLTFGIMWDATMISRGEMQAVARDAGQYAGLGDGRNVGFGRFTIERFDVSEAE